MPRIGSAVRSSTRLPPEVIDIIIEYHRLDRRTIASCSLVSKKWRNSARCHLFSELTLSWKKDTWSLHEFVQSAPTLIPFVRTLRLGYLPHAMWYGETLARAIPLLAYFKNLKSLSLRHFTCLVPNTQFNFTDHLATNSIVRLELINFAPTPLSQLCQLISSFPDLRTLVLHSMTRHQHGYEWEGGDDQLQKLHLSRNLRALELLLPPVNHLLRWVLSQEEKPALRSVYLNYTSVPSQDQHIMGNFLRVLGPSLEFVGWSLDSRFCACNQDPARDANFTLFFLSHGNFPTYRLELQH